MAHRPGFIGPLAEAVHDLAGIRARNDAFAKIELIELISTRPHAAVFKGRLGTQCVAVKVNLEAPRAAAMAQAAELRIVRGWMNDGPFRVPVLRAAWPEDGVTVADWIEGTRFDHVLGAASSADRRQRMAEAAGFLWTYSAPRREVSEFGGRYWLKRARRFSEEVAGGSAGLAAQALEELEHRHGDLIGSPVLKARSHGDFSAINLIAGDDALWGVDIQNAHALPLAKDAARFLVFAETNVPRRFGGRWLGMASEDARPFRTELKRLGQAEFLEFFLGVELLDKLSRNHGTDPKSNRVRAALEMWCASDR